MSKKEQSIEELASAIDLPKRTTKQIVELLKHEMLVSLFRLQPEYPVNEDVIKKNQLKIKVLKNEIEENKKEFGADFAKEKNYDLKVRIAELEDYNENVIKMANEITDNNIRINHTMGSINKIIIKS